MPVRKSSRQHFANLKVGVRKKKKKKRTQDHFMVKKKKLYLAISIWTSLALCLPLFLYHCFFSSLLLNRFSTLQEEQARGAVSCSSSRFRSMN